MHAITGVEITMPAGEYWVGDPCYAVPTSRWDEWLSAAGCYENPMPRILVAELDGQSVLGIGTAHGDGEYLDQKGRSYPVDAGLIGVTPVSLAAKEPFGSHRITFDAPFRCFYDDGTIVLGAIHIETDY